METRHYLYLTTLLFLLPVASVAQYITPEEAVFLANKHIRLEIDRYHEWDGDTSIHIDQVRELLFKGRKIGYYSNIQPTGVIILNLRREFYAVKAFSDHGFLNDADTSGLLKLISARMAAHVDKVTGMFGSIENATVEQVESILEVSGRAGCDYLTEYVPGSVTDFPVLTGNYVEGGTLLTTDWHQGAPYNNECIYLACQNTSNGNALVGCVATAGAQVMRYWSWPLNHFLNPADPYQWWDMRNQVSTSSPAAQQAAVAELSHDVGVQVDMSYGCDESSAASLDMEQVYEQNFYHPSCEVLYRDDYTYDGWWLIIKLQLNMNNPMQYRLSDGTSGHAIVCDGWKETPHYGYPNYHEYHMNYGWTGTMDDIWYYQDLLPNYLVTEEFLFANTVPIGALGSTLSGPYASGFHYVNMMASGSFAIFPSGSVIQTLPAMSITGTGSTPGIRFYGTAGNNTRLYTNGTPGDGIKIISGGMLLKNSGAVRFYRPDDTVPYFPSD